MPKKNEVNLPLEKIKIASFSSTTNEKIFIVC